MYLILDRPHYFFFPLFILYVDTIPYHDDHLNKRVPPVASETECVQEMTSSLKPQRLSIKDFFLARINE